VADVFSKRKRSEVMSRIRGKGNATTELALLGLLRANRITGWRRHLPLPGRPDFAFPILRVAVFVDGCFWHGCPRCSKVPVSNRGFWLRKLEANAERDRRVRRQLVGMGWRVLRVWEHELANPGRTVRRLELVLVKAGRSK
jgi:DNA mismatch endonuclease (patch repair protein)